MHRDPYSIFRGGKRRVKNDVSDCLEAVLHHLHVMTRLDRLEVEDDEDEFSEYHPVYGPDNQFRHQRRAITAELCTVCRTVGASDDVIEAVEDGLSDSDTTVAIEVNYGGLSAAGVEVFKGNKHQEATESCSLGSGRSNHAKQDSVEAMIEQYRDVRWDDTAAMFVFTGHEDSVHVGFKSYDRANEALLELAEPSFRDRLFGRV